jgi:hypothetical protein
MRDSNSRHLRCKRSALPTELITLCGHAYPVLNRSSIRESAIFESSSINLKVISFNYPHAMHTLKIFSLVLLCACDSPSPGMRTGAHYATQVEGISFTIWRRHDTVEIIRHGFIRRQDHTHIKRYMAQAVQSSTGCTLRPETIEGDTGVLRARLACSDPPLRKS